MTILEKRTINLLLVKSLICVVIPAHNEGNVIYNTVNDLFTKQNYPHDLFDVYVICHNCTDNTKQEALRAGAKVIEENNDDPKTHIVSYALKTGYSEILKTGIDYDFVIRLDADNHINDEFFNLMNDAFNNISRMLKKDAYMFLYFHDSSLTVWNDLIKIFDKNDLIFQTS